MRKLVVKTALRRKALIPQWLILPLFFPAVFFYLALFLLTATYTAWLLFSLFLLSLFQPSCLLFPFLHQTSRLYLYVRIEIPSSWLFLMQLKYKYAKRRETVTIFFWMHKGTIVAFKVWKFKYILISLTYTVNALMLI